MEKNLFWGFLSLHLLYYIRQFYLPEDVQKLKKCSYKTCQLPLPNISLKLTN